MYVDDLVSGGTNIAEVENLKQNSIGLFSKGSFHLHEWDWNIPTLENDNTTSEQTYHTPNNYSVVILVIQKS